MTDLWSALSFVLLTKYQGSSRESLLELLSSCECTGEFLLDFLSPCEDTCEFLLKQLSPSEDSLLPLGCLNDQNDEKSISLRGRDRLRNDPQCFPSSLNCCSWMFPERLRNKSELVGSDETHQVLTVHPRYQTLSYWILSRVFLVTLPSISSETWEMLSWVNSGSSVFCTPLFLVLLGVSPEAAASFLLFLNVAVRLREKFDQRRKLNLSLSFYNNENLLLL